MIIATSGTCSATAAATSSGPALNPLTLWTSTRRSTTNRSVPRAPRGTVPLLSEHGRQDVADRRRPVLLPELVGDPPGRLRHVDERPKVDRRRDDDEVAVGGVDHLAHLVQLLL